VIVLIYCARRDRIKLSTVCLVGIGQAAHAAHDAQHVVVGGVHIHVGARLRRVLGNIARVRGDTELREDIRVGGEGGGRQRQVQHGIVNAGEVARAAGLELLGLQCEGIHVDASGGGAGVVLVGLHEVEVAALTLRETVLAVQLDLGHGGRVAQVGVGVAPRGVGRGEAVQVAGVLHHPHDLLAGVVEGQLDLVGGGGHGLSASELKLLNEVLVGHLCEAAALLRVQVHIVHIQRAGHHALLCHVVQHGRIVGSGAAVQVDQVLELSELHVDLHLVVLEGDQRQSQTGVAVEPELQRDVQGLLRDAASQAHSLRLTARLIQGVGGQGGGERRGIGEHAVSAIRGNHGVHTCQRTHIIRGQLSLAGAAGSLGRQSHTAIGVHHVQVGQLLAHGQGQLIPDVQPLTVVLVNLLTTNLHVHVVNQVLAQVGHPGKGIHLIGGGNIVEDGVVNCGQSHLDIHLGDQIAITGDSGLHTLTEVAHTVEGLLNGLHRKVGVAAVKLLEKGHLRVRRQINILCTVGNKLHKTTGSHLYFKNLKLFGQTREKLPGFSYCKPDPPSPP